MKFQRRSAYPIDQEEPLSLSEGARYLLEECRTILPGIQALFGFQLVAVFNDRFAKSLSPLEQRCHLLAIALVAISAALVMAPATYHREVEPNRISARFVRISRIFLLASLLPLAIGISIDFSLIADMIIDNEIIGIVFGVLLFISLNFLWFGVPKLYQRRDKRQQR